MGILTVVVRLLKQLRNWFRSWLLRMVNKAKAKLRMQSLKDSIVKADRIKDETNKKALVVYNNFSQQYEAIEKQKLKKAANLGVIKSSKTRNMKKRRMMDHGRVRQIEKRSLYSTK